MDEGRFVDDAAPGGVDQHGAVSQAAQQLGTDHVPGLIGLGRVDRHDVTAIHQLSQLDLLHSELCRFLVAEVRVGDQDGCLEGGEQFDHVAADTAGTDQADR